MRTTGWMGVGAWCAVAAACGNSATVAETAAATTSATSSATSGAGGMSSATSATATGAGGSGPGCTKNADCKMGQACKMGACGPCSGAADCEAGQVCTMGTCDVCPDNGSVPCGNKCVVLSSDDQNCGKCGNVCSPGAKCIAKACKDPDGAKVALLMHFDGPDGSTTFVEMTGKTVKPQLGNAQISTAQSKFGGASGYFNGSSSLTVATDPAFAFQGDFTFEAWIRLHSLEAPSYARYIIYSDKIDQAFGIINNGGKPALYDFTKGAALIADAMIPFDTWHHIAFVRQGATITGYFDGAAVGAPIMAGGTIEAPPVALWLGRSPLTGGEFWDGYLDELRLTNGLARYTKPFTPPAGPFPDP
jgi:hypothetical protein